MRNSFLRHSLFSLTILLSSIAHAQDPQLSCSGIQEKWLLSIDDLIGAFEYKMNEKLSEYVRIADFNVGDSQFGVTGHGDLGYIDIPEFDKKKPKEYMKSAIHDVAISPSYIIEAKVFESSAEILSASMSAGQGCRSKQNDTDCKDGKPTVGQSNKDRIQFNIKVGGITVLADENAPPETEAPQAIDQPLTPAEMAARLPSEDKKGTGGELLNIRRGFNGNQPIARIPIYDIFYVTIDAGYVLHAGIIFTYGIKSEGIFNVGGSKGYAMDMKSFAPKPQPQGGVSNPALDPQDYENCAMNSTACSSQPSTPTWTKSENFWANTTGPVQNITQQYKKTQDYIRDLRAKEAYRDASITKALWSDNIDKINNDPNLSPEEKDLLMGEMNLSEIKRDMKKIDRLMSNVNYNSQVILSAYNAIEQTIQQISEDGIPEVKANAGVVFDGTASVWANASAEINLNSLVRAWVGLEGGLTAVEATMGLGASVSSRSQYLDITGKLDYEVLKGSISLIWGYNILGAISDSGDMTLFSFPGKTTTYDSMIARVDFDPPAGKTLFFWCSDLFEDPSALDTERCRDGDVGLRKLLPALAAHDEYKKYVLDEAAIFEQNPCIITADGQALATSNETSSQCNNILPSVGGSLNNTTTSAGTTPHPILKSFIQNPQLFLTYLRDNSNKPILNFSTITPTGKFSRTYIASQSVQINPNNGKLEPQTFLPASMGLSTDGIENRLYTITSNGFLYDKPSAEILNSSSAPTETIAKMDGEFATMIADATSPTFQNDTRFQINLNNIKNGSGGTYGNSTTIFVGHLPSLSNQTLVDMAESYRLGECSIATGSSKRHMRIRSQPYPSEGFPNGDTFENAKLDRLGCDLGTDNPTTGPGGQVEAWEACQLRAALVTQKCFPPQRVTELIEFASLQPEQVLAFFSGSNKRISGELGFDAAKTEDIPNGTQDILEVNRTNNFYRSGRPINFNYPSSAPASTSGSAVNIALSNDRSIIVNSTNGGILKDIVSPNGNCPGYQKFNNAAMSFYGTSWAPQPPITDQIVTDLNPGQDVIVNMPVYGASVPVLLINKNGCWNDGGSGLINLNSLVASDQWDSYLNYYPGAFYSGAPSENRPHTVVVLRTQGNTLNAMSQTYFPWGGITWKAYIRSAQIIKPYAIVGKNNTIYPLNPVDPYAIAETYNELPTFQNGGYVFGNTICDPSHSKNINNFPDGPGYGGSRKPQMLSGALHKVEMMKAIGACVTLGGCTYVPISQKRTNPPTCTVQAKMGSTPPQTFNAGNPGKNLDQCLSSNLDFSSAQNFCQAHRQTLSSLITSQGVTSIQLLARWEQLVDIGNDLEKLDQDPASGPHNLGQCVFEKNGASPAQLVGSVNTQDPTAPNGSTDCLLNVSVFGNGNNLTLNSQSIGFTRDPITADYCKARLGYQNAAKSAIFNDNQTLNTCSAITGSQLLRLRSMGMIPTTGIANFDLKAVVSAPGQSNHGQSVTVGSCTIDETTINTKISNETKCTLRMKSGSGEYFGTPIDIYLPPYDPNSGISRLAQCEEAKYRFINSVGAVGSSNICPASLRKRPEYAAMMAVTNNNPINYSFYLGETSAAGPFYCGGSPITGNLNATEYNPFCISELMASPTVNPTAQTYMNLNPVDRMYAIDPNQWLSNANASLYSPATKCNQYWSAEIFSYQPNGTSSNHNYCQSIAGDVKANLATLDPSISSSNSSYTNNGVSTPSWTSNPKSGTVVTVTTKSKVFAPLPPPPPSPYVSKTSGSGKKKTKASSTSKKSTSSKVSSGSGSGSGNKEPDPPGGPGGGGGTSGPPVWQVSAPITTCSYEFKNVQGSEWDLVASTWTTPTSPTNYDNSNVRVRRCVKDAQGQCMDFSAGDLAIFAGSGGRALKKYPASQIPSPLGQGFVDQFCDANYEKITPLADNLVSNPNERFPVWLKFADSQGKVTAPASNETPAYYCKPKNCDLLIEFGSYSELTESEWKNKLSAMPTSANACKTYYQGQVSSYCSQMLLLAQMPDNMEVTLKSVFDGQARTVGTCQAPSTQRTCFIGQRKPESWLSWLMGSQIQVVEEVNNHEKALILPTSTSKTGLVIPNFYANTLEACVDSARELNFNNALCQRNVNGINHNQSYEIAVQFGEFTQTVSACPVAPGPISEPQPAEVTLRTMGAHFEDSNVCEKNIALENYVSGSAIQVAACPNSSCEENELNVVYAGYPTSQKGTPILDVTEFMGTEKPMIRLKDILPSVWDGTNQGTGTIYISQSDHKGNRGNWTQLPSDMFAKSAQDMFKGCPDSSNIFNARLVGNVCEETRIQLSGYSSKQMVEVGICKAAYCNEKKFVPVFKPEVITEENRNVLEFIPVLESTWSHIKGDGTIAVRQVNQEGIAGPWIAIPKTQYESAAQNAFAECGVNP